MVILESSAICDPGRGSVSTNAGGRSGGRAVGVAAASLGVAEGSDEVAVGEGVFLLHPESVLTKPIKIKMEIKMAMTGLLIILCDGCEERIYFSPLRKWKILPENIITFPIYSSF
jgi:hypothetical protein